MPHPAWVGDGFAAALVVVGAYCFARLVAFVPLGRRTHVDVNLGHVVMAVAMVGMLVPGWRTLPAAAWAWVFLLLALWFLGRAAQLVVRDGLWQIAGEGGVHLRHYAVHGVMALSMVYMEALATGSTGRSGTSMGMGAAVGVPVLTLFFIVVLLASAVWQIDGVGRLVPTLQAAAESPGSSPGPPATTSAPTTSAVAVLPRAAAGDAGATSAPTRPWLAPRLEVACHVAMCLAMAYMLVLVV